MKRLLIGLGGAALIALSFNGCAKKAKVESVSISQIREQTGVPVKVAEARVKTIPVRLSVVGTALAPETLNVTPQVGGEIVAIYKDKGDRVRRGELLAQIRKDDYELGLRQAEAALETAEMQLEMARKGARPEELEQARNAVKSAEAASDVARKNSKRMSDLYKQGVISRQVVEMTDAERVAAERQLDSAGQQVDMASTGARKEEIQLLEAQVRQARAALDGAALMLERASILSPCSGTISYRLFNVGESAGTSSAMFQILKEGPLKIAFTVNESDLGKIRLGEKARFWPQGAGRGEAAEAEVAYIGKFVDRMTRQGEVEAEVRSGSGSLKHGMFVEGDLIVDEVRGLAVPYKALVKNREVLVVENDKAVRHLCENVRRIDGFSSVEGDCVKEGELVVVEGQSALADGAKVKVVEKVEY